MKTYNIDVLSIIKSLIVVYIILSVFFNFNKKLTFIDNKAAKIVLLIVVLAVMYYDLHTGILLTIAFLMIIIQFNSISLNDIQAKKIEFFSAEYNKNDKDPEHIVTFKKSLECDNEKKNEISDDIFDYTVDTKVKPYEVFVKMITTKEHLDNASNSAILQP
jgi:MFS superfamily sulfate permease-like transporter